MPASVVTTRHLTSAASTPATAAMLRGAVRSARVVHSGADAAYLQLDDGGCLGVLSATARAVPCGLRTTLATIDIAQGSVATVGDDMLRVGGLDIRIGRLIDARVPKLLDVPDAALSVISDHPAVRAARAELPDISLRQLQARDADAVIGLLGRGSGLTPLGDDVLCGYLASSVAAGHDEDVATIAAEVERIAHQRTTALSTQLLTCATAGDVLPEFAALVRDINDPGSALDELVRVGHTSGAGLALGLTLAPMDSGRTPA